MKPNNKKRSNSKGFAEIFGTHAVHAALQNPNRRHEKLFISQNQRKILNKDIEKFVPDINELHNKEMFKMFGNEATHQGIVLRTSKLIQPNLSELINNSKKNKSDVVVMLDQVTDPNNIGSIMRSCVLFNCKAIIISNDNAPNITGTMAKAASGALETVNYISVVNLSRAMIQFKKNDYWIYGFDNNEINNQNINLDLPKKCVLVFGSEGKGIRNLTKKECDTLVSIPMQAHKQYKIDSLNVSNACSIALYEHFKNNIK
jgi:23S rRNA (guanosine2251-2'-O)-methyltransferase